MNPSVAVVILNWNGKILSGAVFTWYCQFCYSNLQIIVGDNCSTDNSIAYIRSAFPSGQDYPERS